MLDRINLQCSIETDIQRNSDDFTSGKDDQYTNMAPKTNLDIVFGAMTFGKEGTLSLHPTQNLHYH